MIEALLAAIAVLLFMNFVVLLMIKDTLSRM